MSSEECFFSRYNSEGRKMAKEEKHDSSEKEIQRLVNGKNEMIRMNGEAWATKVQLENASLRRENLLKRLQRKKKEYIDRSTIHGVPRIISESKLESSFWLCVVLVGIAYSAYGTSTLISKYYQYSIYSAISSVSTNINLFPSVTFCDRNLMLDNYFAFCGVERGKLHTNPHMQCLGKPKRVTNIRRKFVEDGKWSNGVFLVTYCQTWGGKKCANSSYFTSLDKHGHSCFTWNWNGDLYDAYGHADIRFELNETSGLNFSRIFAIVHDPDISELEIMNQIHLDPNKAYQLRISKTEMRRLPHPFPSNCTNSKPHSIFPGKYTRTMCIDSINYMEMLKHCGETFDYIKNVIPESIVEKYQRNLSISHALKCMKDFSRRQVNSTDYCPVPCNEIELSVITTTYNIQSNSSAYRVEIQFDKFDSHKVVEEKQLFTWEQIAGEIGGFLGLITGVSFVSVIELIAYFTFCLAERWIRFSNIN